MDMDQRRPTVNFEHVPIKFEPDADPQHKESEKLVSVVEAGPTSLKTESPDLKTEPQALQPAAAGTEQPGRSASQLPPTRTTPYMSVLSLDFEVNPKRCTELVKLLTDKDLGLINTDSNGEVTDIFQKLNEELFHSTMPHIQVAWLTRIRGKLSQFKHNQIQLNRSHLKDKPRSEIVNVILHEAVKFYVEHVRGVHGWQLESVIESVMKKINDNCSTEIMLDNSRGYVDLNPTTPATRSVMQGREDLETFMQERKVPSKRHFKRFILDLAEIVFKDHKEYKLLAKQITPKWNRRLISTHAYTRKTASGIPFYQIHVSEKVFKDKDAHELSLLLLYEMIHVFTWEADKSEYGVNFLQLVNETKRKFEINITVNGEHLLKKHDFMRRKAEDQHRRKNDDAGGAST